MRGVTLHGHINAICDFPDVRTTTGPFDLPHRFETPGSRTSEKPPRLRNHDSLIFTFGLPIQHGRPYGLYTVLGAVGILGTQQRRAGPAKARRGPEPRRRRPAAPRCRDAPAVQREVLRHDPLLRAPQIHGPPHHRLHPESLFREDVPRWFEGKVSCPRLAQA